MADSDPGFLKLEMQLHFLEAAMADTAFVVNHLLKDLNNPAIADEQRNELQAAEHHLRILLHQIRAYAQQEIETETQASEGQRVYHELLQQFETATYDFVDRAAALVAALPPKERAEVQASLDVLRDFREDFSTLK
jgi:hypothetical protein